MKRPNDLSSDHKLAERRDIKRFRENNLSPRSKSAAVQIDIYWGNGFGGYRLTYRIDTPDTHLKRARPLNIVFHRLQGTRVKRLYSQALQRVRGIICKIEISSIMVVDEVIGFGMVEIFRRSLSNFGFLRAECYRFGDTRTYTTYICG